MSNRNIIYIALVTAFILMIPLVAMQFTNEVQWSPFDFIFIGVLLFGAGLAYELIARKMNNLSYKAALGCAIVTAVLLVWVNAAVGIIGDDNLANIMYPGVIALGVIGALIARFKASGMAHALFATALAQVVVAVIALIFFFSAEPGPLGVLALNGFFTVLWLGSALLFLRAAHTRTKRHVRTKRA